MSVSKHKFIVELISILFVILFLYTGISKLMDYTIFKEQIATSALLAPVARPIAFWLPVIEFFVVLLIIVPRWRLKGLYVALALMILFAGYIIAILTFNEHIPCSCGGVLELLSWKQHIVFNGVFILMAVTGIVLEKRLRTISKRIWVSITETKLEHE